MSRHLCEGTCVGEYMHDNDPCGTCEREAVLSALDDLDRAVRAADPGDCYPYQEIVLDLIDASRSALETK